MIVFMVVVVCKIFLLCRFWFGEFLGLFGLKESRGEFFLFKLLFCNNVNGVEGVLVFVLWGVFVLLLLEFDLL